MASVLVGSCEPDADAESHVARDEPAVGELVEHRRGPEQARARGDAARADKHPGPGPIVDAAADRSGDQQRNSQRRRLLGYCPEYPCLYEPKGDARIGACSLSFSVPRIGTLDTSAPALSAIARRQWAIELRPPSIPISGAVCASSEYLSRS